MQPILLPSLGNVDVKTASDEIIPFNSLRRRNVQPIGDGDGEDDTDLDSQSTESQGSELPHERHIASSSRSGSASSSTLAGMRGRLKSPLIGTLKLDDLRENISKGVEVKFAPLQIPPHRRFQTAAVAFWALLPIICLFCFFLAMSFPPLWLVLIPYLVWIQFDQAPERGGRSKDWARRSSVFRYFAEYYPCSIVKEADLPPDRPYLFGYHPHGIIGIGAFATFATEATKFSELFPGIKPHLLTLESNFKLPFYRDVLLLLGVCSVSKISCANILSLGPGNAIAIVVGGAAESLSAHPGTADLTLKKRFGFIKMAIRAGADLVPVFSFGENDIYDQLANSKGSMVYKLQKRFQQAFGFTLPLFYGRGIFNYNYGFMPFRHPIVSVVGSPIRVQKHPTPSDEMVQEFQQMYIDELLHIWDKYKDVYAAHRTKELTLTYIPPRDQSPSDLSWMREALIMAEEALASDEVPVGCVFVRQGRAIARARNRTNEWRNATLHAELEAIDHLLPMHPAPFSSITLYVTVEPCVMCASALRQIGIGKVVYGCGNDRFGGCGSVIDVNTSELLDTHPPYVAEGGYYREEAIMLLRRFYMSENQNAPNPKRKGTRVLKTEIPPPPSSSGTPRSSRPTSTVPPDLAAMRMTEESSVKVGK
ncbi:MAG: diacylglycerol O-acyltransferase 1 [Tremellales sp. Tagirdzhanova-0007]|nr:MAG: diacylglycerol O-acyltransferase 1 [Tremellales sp. Tagirdzhanova-0007]